MKLIVMLGYILLMAGCSSSGVERDEVATETIAGAPVNEQGAIKDAEDVASVDDGDKVICYREQKSGSHFTRKVCKTKRQMTEDRRKAQELMDRSRTHDERVMMEGQ